MLLLTLKVKGSDDGKFIGTNVLNEAFLERFPVTFEQEYPGNNKTEIKIVATKLKSANKSDDKFASKLSDLGTDVIRKTFKDGGVDEIISTRRLVHIAEAYAIFKNKMKAIEVCTNRFDDSTKHHLLTYIPKLIVVLVPNRSLKTRRRLLKRQSYCKIETRFR